MADIYDLQSTPVAGTDATDTAYIHNATGQKLRILAVSIVPKTSVSTHASNYITTSIKKGSDTITAHTTNSSGGSALTAGTVKDLSLTGVGKVLEIDDGGVITVDVAKNGTGPAYSNYISIKAMELRS